MKKILVLIFSILIPLTAAVAIGFYGYNVRYLPSANTSILGEFQRYMNEGIITSEERIENYRKMENYYYEEDPIFKKDITNEEGEKLMTLAVYRNLCIYQPKLDAEPTLKTLFEVFAYNINYDLIKEYFYLDDMTVIEEAGMPTLEVTFTPTNGKEEFTITLANRSNVVIPDYKSVPEWDDEETKTRNYVQSQIFREYETSNTLKKFSDDANITVKATIKVENEDETTTTLEADKPIAEEYIADFKHKGEDIDETTLGKGYREASVDETYYNAGFKGWLFKNYIWWQALIGFVLVGLVTGSFALIYFGEEQKSKQQPKKKRK